MTKIDTCRDRCKKWFWLNFVIIYTIELTVILPNNHFYHDKSDKLEIFCTYVYSWQFLNLKFFCKISALSKIFSLPHAWKSETLVTQGSCGKKYFDSIKKSFFPTVMNMSIFFCKKNYLRIYNHANYLHSSQTVFTVCLRAECINAILTFSHKRPALVVRSLRG